MRWTPGGVSGDIEDRRDSSGGGGFGFGGGGVPFGIGGLLVLLVLSFVFKRDLISPFLNSGSPGNSPGVSRPVDPARKAAESREVQFVSFVLDDAQSDWDKLIPNYRHAKLVLFRDFTQSACGVAQSATGPFYCPADEKVYIDLGFYDELRDRFGAPGDFAQAYVLSHEIGHHVQKILGIAGKVQRLQQQSPAQANPLSVRMELQADCLAGVWAHSTAQRNLIDKSDIEAGIQAAGAVGDDRLQRMARGSVSPESFTHGTSAQRVAWFERGLESGQISACNTFAEH